MLAEHGSLDTLGHELIGVVPDCFPRHDSGSGQLLASQLGTERLGWCDDSTFTSI